MLSNTAIRDYLTTLQPTWGATHWAAATGFGRSTLGSWLRGEYCPRRHQWGAFLAALGQGEEANEVAWAAWSRAARGGL